MKRRLNIRLPSVVEPRSRNFDEMWRSVEPYWPEIPRLLAIASRHAWGSRGRGTQTCNFSPVAEMAPSAVASGRLP